MLFFRKRSKTPDPQEGKMSNPWEKEKKSYQSTIEKLVARKADIYAHLGAAIAYQAKDDPAVLLPYPIQAAALNDIEQKNRSVQETNGTGGKHHPARGDSLDENLFVRGILPAIGGILLCMRCANTSR